MKNNFEKAQKFIIYTITTLFVILAFLEIIVPGYRISPTVASVVGLVIGLAFGARTAYELWKDRE